jgi:hypothetical protein
MSETKEKQLLTEIKYELKWNDDDDESFHKHKSFYSLLKLKTKNIIDYLDSVESPYLLDMYVYKWKKALELYSDLMKLNTNNKDKHTQKHTKIMNIAEFIL